MRKQNPVGFPKPQVKGKGSFTMPKPTPLDPSCEIGDYVSSGEFVGVLEALDSNKTKATLKIADGTLVVVEVC